ncbi:hypothetical protein IRJ41_019186 [Triplophysa rosa]|uniref:Uncharacterized protein n=1 Tax=Triplophysa rosa TaxID=992332 RepID=A0A9W7WBI8_TRIRA|nr:hypothetical protein IRJ41_019186 [Triplophysa rosa]
MEPNLFYKRDQRPCARIETLVNPHSPQTCAIGGRVHTVQIREIRHSTDRLSLSKEESVFLNPLCILYVWLCSALRHNNQPPPTWSAESPGAMVQQPGLAAGVKERGFADAVIHRGRNQETATKRMNRHSFILEASEVWCYAARLC